MSSRADRAYESDDRDLEGCDNELVVFYGENGDWYVMIRRIGDRCGQSVRVTTSGAPRGRHGVMVAVARLYDALKVEVPGEGDASSIPRVPDGSARSAVFEIDPCDARPTDTCASCGHERRAHFFEHCFAGCPCGGFKNLPIPAEVLP